jgi:hypothetical protein
MKDMVLALTMGLDVSYNLFIYHGVYKENKMNKIWDSYLPCIAMAYFFQVICV